MKINWYRFVSGGSCYDFTAYTNQKTGEVIIRPRHNSKGKGIKAWLQQLIRSRWGQVVNAYQQLAPFLEGAFTTGDERWRNPFNVFMSLNVPLSEVYLTKGQCADGACVLEDFVVATGKLSAIVLEEQGEWLVSNVRLRNLQEINAQTTILDLTVALCGASVEGVEDGMVTDPSARLKNGEKFLPGDELYFWRVYQVDDIEPRLEVMRYSMHLSLDDTRKVHDVCGSDGFQVVQRGEGYYLACKKIMNTGCVYIRSRREHDAVHASYARLKSYSTLLSDYSSRQAQLKAVNSYGGVNHTSYVAPTPNENYFLNFLEAGGELPKPMGSTGSGSQGSGSTGGSTGGGSTQQVTVSCIINGANADKGTVSPASVTVDRGSQVTFTASVQTGFKPQWPNNSNALSYTVTANDNMSITLEFVPDSGLSVKEGEEEE